ncbi:MAG: [protein-PII] uridylyltransferase [Chthoniobacterales bacterium]
MSRHHEKLLANAERQLAAAGARRPTDVLPIYKKFLKIEEHRLRLKHQSGGGGREICGLRVELVDVLLRRVFAAATAFAREERVEPTPLALIALGGYGRGELNPFSDVDVLFVHSESANELSPYAGDVIEQILYLLWDIGFKVGHATRSVDEAVVHANSDMLAKTAMLEARHVIGDHRLWTAFREQFHKQCLEGREEEYVEMRMRDQAARHKKFGDSVYMQEPNIKSGCGGLRDYQNLLWVTSFKESSVTPKHLESKEWLSQGDLRRIEAAYDFLLRLRTDLHYATGRASDILHLNFQDALAQRLGYRHRSGVLRSEALMKDFYEHTRNIFRVTERVTAQFASGGSPFEVCASNAPEERVDEFVIRGGYICVERNDVFARSPESMMRLFQLLQERRVEIAPQLADLVTRNLGVVTRTFQYAKGPREIFKSILSRKGEAGRALRAMHRIDFLGRYIPEFGQLTCLVQHEFFHRYTADEHTLVCIEKLDALATTDDPKFLEYRKLFERLDDPFVLYLALLLHDTGRAVGARPHSEASAVFAQRAAMRLQLSSTQRRTLIRLVDHHVTMSTLAQQRNLDDPETAMEFANIVKDQPTLDALMLLTLADGQGTSAEAWSDWKESLVWQLYHVTSRYLGDERNFHEQANVHRDALETAVGEQLTPDHGAEIEAHFDFMPDNYFRAFGIATVASHVELFRTFLTKLYSSEDAPLIPAIRWEPFPRQGHTIVSFAGWDAQHVLAKIAGSLAVVPVNILSADIYPRGDNLVLHVFRVCDISNRAVTDPRDHELVEMTLRHALTADGFDFGPLLERARRKIPKRLTRDIEFPTRISIDNKAHRSYTLVQVEVADRVGLLYELLSAFERQRVFIALSRIITEKGAAIDTFYIVDQATRAKITDSERIAVLQKTLRDAATSPR